MNTAMSTTSTHRLHRRLREETGTALILAMMSMMLLTALAAAVVMVSSTEIKIASNYSAGQEALYAADAAVERVVQDLLMIPRWNDLLTGSATSGFIDGDMNGEKVLMGGGKLTLCCGTNSATGQLQADTNTLNLWGANNPQWRLISWGPIGNLLETTVLDSPMYVAVWVADDPAESDGAPLSDANGTLSLHAEAYGPDGSRKVLEVTVARTSSTEIERGQIAQRGQEELNQRARKAAVQTPGKALTAMDMNVASGGMVIR